MLATNVTISPITCAHAATAMSVAWTYDTIGCRPSTWYFSPPIIGLWGISCICVYDITTTVVSALFIFYLELFKVSAGILNRFWVLQAAASSFMEPGFFFGFFIHGTRRVLRTAV